MTTAVEVKRWTRPIWEGRRDVVLRKRRLIMVPFSHVCREIMFLGSSDRTDPRPAWLFQLSFMPPGYPNHLWFGYLHVGRSTDAGFAEHIVERLEEKIDSDLAPVTTIEAFHEMTIEDRRMDAGTGPWALSRSPAYHAVVLAALGRVEEAVVAADQEVSRLEPYWHRILHAGQERAASKCTKRDGEHLIELASKQLDKLAELRRLRDLAQADDRFGVTALLRQWEAQRIKAWELEDLWTLKPFPIELGARS